MNKTMPLHPPSVRCHRHGCTQNVPLHKESGLPRDKYNTSDGPVCRVCLGTTRKCSVSECLVYNFDNKFPDGIHCLDCLYNAPCPCDHCKNQYSARRFQVLLQLPLICERNGCSRDVSTGLPTCPEHTVS